VFTLDDRLAARVRSADYQDWRAKVTATGGCAKPIRLTGAHQLQHATTGAVLHHFGGDIMVPCGNRRSSVCPSCSDRYAADAFHLIRAGLVGGSKDVPETVTDAPRAFVTLTAPSFGPVHGRPVLASGKTRRCGCGEYHHEADTRLGTPLDPDSYDYVGSVLWQAHAGKLWHRFVIQLRRELARLVGIRVRDFTQQARLSYGKVAEYQRRGLVHFHAIIRVDGPEGPTNPAPSWATASLLDAAVRAAAAAVTVTTHRPDSSPLVLAWGAQVDIRPIQSADAGRFEGEHAEVTDQHLAGYIAKYATKGTGTSEAADKPIRSQLDIEHLRCSEHHRRIIQTAWDLGGRADYEELKLRRWAHMLGFRGHFLTKSKHYSTTFSRMRDDRRAYRLSESLERLEITEPVLVVNDWDFTGVGYRNDAERELAAGIAERVRDARTRKHEQENRS
jgi:hypothetical protein